VLVVEVDDVDVEALVVEVDDVDVEALAGRVDRCPDVLRAAVDPAGAFADFSPDARAGENV